MMNNKVAIIPAAGRGQRMLSMTDNCPKSMLPVGNKPLISYHLEKLIKEKINDVYIVVGYKKEVLINYVSMMYGDKLNIIFVEQNELLGLAHAIKLAVDKIPKNKYSGLLVMLGDIIVTDENIFSTIKSNISFVAYKEVSDYSRWCLLNLDKNNNILNFIDKPDTEPDEKNAVIGVYYFNNINDFIFALDDVILNNIRIKNEFQLSSVMELYINKYNNVLKGVNCDLWFDFGEIETYNESKKYFNIARNFNSIKYQNDSIIKHSKNYNKLQREILWFLSLPLELQKYIPKLLSYSLIDNDVFYELEYINGTSLQELFIYNYLSYEDWTKILKLIDTAITDFKKASKTHKSNLYKFLNTNYNNRLDMIRKSGNGVIIELIDDCRDKIVINDKTYLSFNSLKSYISDKLNKLSLDDEKYSQIIHGDMVFSNIIYNIGNNQIKLIDPRGNFNEDIVYGDIRYDLAKICQCIIGKYDYIVNDLVKLSYVISSDNKPNVINYSIYNFNEHCDIAILFDKLIEKHNCKLSDVLFITALQFLTMIPLHSESMTHQIMMFSKFIELMNESISCSDN